VKNLKKKSDGQTKVRVVPEIFATIRRAVPATKPTALRSSTSTNGRSAMDAAQFRMCVSNSDRPMSFTWSMRRCLSASPAKIKETYRNGDAIDKVGAKVK
jgi:hypothetical protein